MSPGETLALFGVFGAVCAFYVSVVGFALTAVVIIGALGLAGAAGFHHFGVWLLLGSFVILQVGYVAGVIGIAVAGHIRRLSTKDPSRIKGERRINQE